MKNEMEKQTNHEASLEPMLLKYLMTHTSDAVYFKDAASRFIAVSNAMARLFGRRDRSEMLGKTDFDFFLPEHAQQAFDDEREIMRTGKPIVAKEEKETWPDGRETWALTTKMPLRDEAGRIIGTFGISRDITDRKMIEEELRKSEQKLRLQNEALQRDLERARTIQNALLPSQMPHHRHLFIECRYHPLETVGGDYFSFTPLPNDGVGVFIGDLTGHGVSAALFMALIHFLTDSLGPVWGYNPKAYLESLNGKLMNQMPSAFITAIYGFFQFDTDKSEGRFVLADAGHPRPLLSRASTSEIELIKPRGNAAIGLIDDFQTEPTEILLNKGDRLFLYTDGITETRNVNDDVIGEEGLPSLIQRATRPDLSETLNAVMAEVDQFRGEQDNFDDIVIVGFEVR